MKQRAIAIFTCLMLCIPGFLRAQIITTLAGNGTAGYTGDGGICYSARLNDCSGVAFDGAGNVFIADFGNHVVRKINSMGIISTIAGNGTAGYSGDGGQATAAHLNGPYGVAVDGAGNLYISDNGNNVIRRVTAAGIIATFAGHGVAGYSGDGGPAALAKLNSPEGIATDHSGNLYISDAGNNAVRKVLTTGNISTLCGGPAAGYTGDGGMASQARLSSPASVAIDPFGQVYIADYQNHAIRKIDTNALISTFAGNGIPGYFGNGGPATASELRFPSGVAVFGFNDIYVADQGNNVVRHINGSKIISSFAGNTSVGYSGDNGPSVAASLKTPKSVTADGAGRVFIADQGNNVVRLVNTLENVSADNSLTTRLRVYPNPTKGDLTVELTRPDGPGKVLLLDLLGRVVASRQLNLSDAAIYFSRLPAGSYMLRVEDNSGAETVNVQVW